MINVNLHALKSPHSPIDNPSIHSNQLIFLCILFNNPCINPYFHISGQSKDDEGVRKAAKIHKLTERLKNENKALRKLKELKDVQKAENQVASYVSFTFLLNFPL